MRNRIANQTVQALPSVQRFGLGVFYLSRPAAGIESRSLRVPADDGKLRSLSAHEGEWSIRGTGELVAHLLGFRLGKRGAEDLGLVVFEALDFGLHVS